MKKRIQILLAALVMSVGSLLPAAVAAVPVLDTPPSAPDRQEPYLLTAAYPNPFSVSTRFDLTVRQRQNVQVEIYNLLGRRVQTLYSGIMETGETRTFVFEANELPSGIYLFRVSGDRFTAARQVTLVR